MAEATADRNLLFGILALQMDFISRDALIKGMNAWVLEKAKPLGQILVEQKVLGSDRQALLEALVQEHLKQHSNDPEKSLAAVSAVGSIREALQQIADADLHASLLHVSAARPADDDPYATRAPSVGAPTGNGPRFRILRPHARGGLGEVFVAQDEELHREVALKEIQNRHADNPESRSRFLVEAEITGRLEHPGIVPVYGLGQYADGRPFYAMRFIRGDSLKDAIDRFHHGRAEGGSPPVDPSGRALEFRNLLGRFLDVCNAIAYAHSRGVLHRDLKPGNIMLGKYGETLVVDWGLAKPLQQADPGTASTEGALQLSSTSGASFTQMGSAVGTPQYMSPEQAAGRLDQLGPASDVYSLGATLYCLLTGKPPFEEADLGKLLQKVQRGDFPPPQQVNENVPPPLAAICRKAMALQPAKRYASPRALAEDVEHWLADEPVQAYAEPWGVRLGRWARRHKSLVTGAAALLVTAVVALGISTTLIGREQARTQAARLRAEKNFRLARDAVDHYYVRLGKERLLNEPGLQPLRHDLLQEARAFYQQFVAERAHDPDLQADMARAYLQLGNLTADIDSKPHALELLQESLAIAQRLTTRQPDVADHRHLLSQCYNSQGVLYLGLGQFEQAEESFQSAIDVEQELLRKFPDTDTYRDYLGLCYLNLGIARKDRRQLAPAEEALRQSVALLTPLVDRPQPDDQAASDLAGSWTNLGIVYGSSDQNRKAEKAFQKALEIRQQLVRRHPAMLEYRNNLASSYNNLGALRRTIGALDQAQTSLAMALAIRQKVADENPAVTQYQDALANIHLNLGNLYQQQHQVRQAQAAYEKALQIWTRLNRDHHDVPAFRNGVGWAAYHLGRLLKADHQSAAALGWYDQAIQAIEAVPTSPRGQSQGVLCQAYRGRASILDELDRPAEGLADWDRALALAEESEQKEARAERAQAATRLMQHAVRLASQANYGSLLAEVAAAARRPELSGETLYWLARIPAMVATAGRTDPGLAPKQAEQAADQALVLLRRARAAGFPSPTQQRLLQTDPALEALRSRAEFQKLVRPDRRQP